MDHRSGGDLDEETVARKRSRRVSFADTTAIHVFDRDEDYETPPTDSKPSPAGDHEFLGFRTDHSDTDDSKGSRDDNDGGNGDGDDEDGEEDEERFVRDMDSSPGSAFGSVTSNDDDNFFGPVSTSFIKSGQLSESGMSDDNNHDITLDSTAFSLHFQNIAPPDSANSSKSLRTPTENSVPTNSPGFVVPKGFIQQVSRSRLSAEKLSGNSGSSTNMSLIVENPHRYDDYGEMSPTLEALLTEANKRIHHDSPVNGIGTVANKACGDEVASGNDDTASNSMRAAGNTAEDAHISGSCSMVIAGKQICNGLPSPPEAESPPRYAPVNEKTQVPLSPKIGGSFEDVCEDIHAQNTDVVKPTDRNSQYDLTSQSNQIDVDPLSDKVRRDKHDSNSSPELRPVFSTVLSMDGKKQAVLPELGMHTPKDAVQPLPTQLHGSISSLRARRQQLFDPTVLSQTRLIYTPDQPPSSLKIDLAQFGERISNIESHISKSKVPKSPNIMDSRQALFDKDDPLPPELEVRVTMEKNNINDLMIKPIVVSETKTQDTLNGDSETNLHKISLEPNCLKFQAEQIVTVLTHLEKNEVSTSDLHESGLAEGTLQFKESSQEGFFSPKANGTTSSSAFFEENDIPFDNCNRIPSNNSQKQIEHSWNCSSQRQAELTSSISSKEVKDLPSSSQPALDVVYKETSTINKSMKMQLSSDGSLQSPNKKTNSNNGIVHLSEMVSSKPSKDPTFFDHQFMRDVLSVEEAISGRKRAIGQTLATDKDHTGELRSQKSPKVTDGNSGIVGWYLQCSNGSESIVNEEPPQRHWRDMISTVSDFTRQLFPVAICKLSSQELDILEDALSELQIGRKYDRLSASLKNQVFSGVQKREAVASSLLDRYIYEKAKVQLKRIKLDQLSNKAKLCKLRIQEYEKLKSIYSRLHVLEPRAMQESQMHSVSSNHSGRNQEEADRVTSMRQELEALGQKVNLLVSSFESSCKIKGNMSCDVIISAVRKFLETTKCCRGIQQDLQLWKLSDVVKKDGCCSIILNNCNLLTQRFEISFSSVANMVASSILDDASIEKNFPNVNASTAFQFVLKNKADGKVTSLKHLQQKTMETNFRFGTLLDVLEEVLVSRMKFYNLISSTFHSKCSDQLELQLCFLSFKSGKKVSLSLDLTSLNCAVYPSETSDLRIQISNELPSSIADEIKGTVLNLPNGRPMIHRMCHSISQVVKSSI